jgi:hypothetical protein
MCMAQALLSVLSRRRLEHMLEHVRQRVTVREGQATRQPCIERQRVQARRHRPTRSSTPKHPQTPRRTSFKTGTRTTRFGRHGIIAGSHQPRAARVRDDGDIPASLARQSEASLCSEAHRFQQLELGGRSGPRNGVWYPPFASSALGYVRAKSDRQCRHSPRSPVHRRSPAQRHRFARTRGG